MTTLRTSPTFDAPAAPPGTGRKRRPSAVVLLVSIALALSGTSLGSGDDTADAATAVTATGSKFTFSGGGWGHGVGMSQWGARGMANNRSSHTQILQHYYSGAQVGSRSNGANLRILIAERASTLTLTASGHTTFDGVGNIAAGQTVTLTRSGSSIRLGGALSATVGSPLTVRYHENPLKVSPPGYSYRHGQLTVRTDTSGLRAIVSDLPMNKYLWGLHEMPASWPREALKAQAVAGRTYALKRRASRVAAGADFDLYATVTDQAYTGTTNEGSWYLNWVAAVEETTGQVVTHNGGLIDAVYSSSSGGHTESSENVWVTALPYLRGVSDPHDVGGGNSNASWSRTYTGAQLGSWFGIGTVTSVSILGPFGVSGRVDKATIRLVGTGGTKNVTGTALRSKINSKNSFSNQLMSTKFTVVGAGLPPSTPNRPPTGDYHSAFARGRTVVIGGKASDPDGVPLVKVVSTMGSQRAERHTRPNSAGSFMVAWDGAPGTRKVCVSVVDVPSGQEHSLGCKNVVVK